MGEVYGKKARQINAQDPAHRRAYTWVNAQCKERKGKKWRKRKEEKKLPVPGRGFEPTTLTLEGKAPVCIAKLHFTKILGFICFINTMKDSYILNSIAQYPLHMMERERESVIELNLKVQKTINIAEYEMTTNY